MFQLSILSISHTCLVIIFLFVDEVKFTLKNHNCFFEPGVPPMDTSEGKLPINIDTVSQSKLNTIENLT